MGFYDVVKPCVVGKLHYARPTTQPIEVDDAVAEALVEDGSLQPYRPGGIPGKTGTVLDGGSKAGEEFSAKFARPPEQPAPARRPRGRRQSSED